MCGKWPRSNRIAKQPSVHCIVVASTARTEEMIQGHAQMRLKSVLDRTPMVGLALGVRIDTK